MSANIYKKKNCQCQLKTSRHRKNLERLTNYFEPKQNIIYQRYMFNSCIERQSEKFDAYQIKLRHLIKTCEYGALEDELLRGRIVTGKSNNNVWARLLSESGLTLDRAINICRSTEQATTARQTEQLTRDYYTKADKKRHENS